MILLDYSYTHSYQYLGIHTDYRYRDGPKTKKTTRKVHLSKSSSVSHDINVRNLVVSPMFGQTQVENHRFSPIFHLMSWGSPLATRFGQHRTGQSLVMLAGGWVLVMGYDTPEYTSIHPSIYLSIYRSIDLCTCICAYLYIYIYILSYWYMRICRCTLICICVCICTCILKYL